jgi:hypothetical protein
MCMGRSHNLNDQRLVCSHTGIHGRSRLVLTSTDTQTDTGIGHISALLSHCQLDHSNVSDRTLLCIAHTLF